MVEILSLSNLGYARLKIISVHIYSGSAPTSSITASIFPLNLDFAVLIAMLLPFLELYTLAFLSDLLYSKLDLVDTEQT